MKTVPTKGIAAADVAGYFMKGLVCSFGSLGKLIANRGGCFASKFFTDVFKIM